MQTSIDDLKVAYKRTQLKRLGISFLQAMESPMLLRCMTRLAECALKKQEALGKPAPMQPDSARGRHHA